MKPVGSHWKSLAISAVPSATSAIARLERSNTRSGASLSLPLASRCRSSATSSGPGCGTRPIGAASALAAGWNGAVPGSSRSDASSQV